MIVRPVNMLLACLSVYLGAWTAQPFTFSIKIALACASAAFILAAGNVINDYFDVEIDRLNKPNRPLPSGKLTRKSALWFAIILFTFGVFLSIFISRISFWLATLVSVGLFFYGYRLKRTVLWGNFSVSLFSALVFVYGGLAAGSWTGSVIPAGFAFFFHLGREIIKDIEDMEADNARAARTLPVVFGTFKASLAATIVFCLLIVLTIVPYMTGIYGKIYIIVVSVGVDFVILCSLFFLWRNPSSNTLKRISTVLKIDMIVGLAAVVLGTRIGSVLE